MRQRLAEKPCPVTIKAITVIQGYAWGHLQNIEHIGPICSLLRPKRISLPSFQIYFLIRDPWFLSGYLIPNFCLDPWSLIFVCIHHWFCCWFFLSLIFVLNPWFLMVLHPHPPNPTPTLKLHHYLLDGLCTEFYPSTISRNIFSLQEQLPWYMICSAYIRLSGPPNGLYDVLPKVYCR